ncbi:MAG: HRDC domain-containing protein [Chloroflexi bacterium]|nr:HRDC domain-containing protein [Chloroflexota bacterium]
MSLNPRQQAALKNLNIFRDQEAKKRNQPLFKIMGDKTLLQIAKALPRNPHDLQGIYGMSHGQVRRFGEALLSIIAASQNEPPPKRPKPHKRPPEAVVCRYENCINGAKPAPENGALNQMLSSVVTACGILPAKTPPPRKN